MNIKPIIAVLSIAGSTVVLTGCSGEGKTSFDTAMQALNGGVPLLGSEPVPATLVASVPEAVVEAVAVVEPEPFVEPGPPAPTMVEVCRDEPRRGGLWFERVCEMRPAT